MLRKGYSDHFLSIVHLCVCLSFNIFKWCLKPLSQFCSNFIWRLLRLGERKTAKMVMVCWLRWLPCPYVVKTFKNLFLQNLGCIGAESLHKSLGKGLQKLLKLWSYIDVWPFYSEVKFASLFICMGPIHLYRKNVENFKLLLFWSLWTNVAQISRGASLGQENESVKVVMVHLPRWPPCLYMVKTFKNLLHQN